MKSLSIKLILSWYIHVRRCNIFWSCIYQDGFLFYNSKEILRESNNASLDVLLTPVSNQENKHRIGLEWTIHTAGQKSCKYFNFLSSGLRITGSSWNRKPIRRFNFVPIRSDPMFIFLSGKFTYLFGSLYFLLHFISKCFLTHIWYRRLHDW